MNINIKKEIPDQFVVPKDTVVLRENQEVVFKVVSNKAY